MNVLVIGSGGREHALVWKIAQSPQVARLFCVPGNPGVEGLAECYPVPATDMEGLLHFALDQKIDLTVVGPEQPLALGIVNRFAEYGLKAFGPTREAAQLEWSKSYAKTFMQRYGIPTARSQIFSAGDKARAADALRSVSYPVVIKEDGLAAGKGVAICEDPPSALAALTQMMQTAPDKSGTVIIEEYMEGEEASVFAVCDGSRYVTLAAAQDHKRVFDGDQGKNTGGMGAYAPAPVVIPEIMDYVQRSIIEPTLRGMVAEGRPFTGCLYVGLMLTQGGPRVVEYNVRFGDPEAQVVLPLYRGDIIELMTAACEGRIGSLAGVQGVSAGSAVCVVLASGGYPGSYETGKPIHGLDTLAGLPGLVAFHAGTKTDHGVIVTSGGRVLGITAISDTEDLKQTIVKAYDGVGRIRFDGMHYRKDIGSKALARQSALA